MRFKQAPQQEYARCLGLLLKQHSEMVCIILKEQNKKRIKKHLFNSTVIQWRIQAHLAGI